MKPIEEILHTHLIDDPYRRALLNIVYTGGGLVNRMNHVLKPFRITEPQFNVLRILRGSIGSMSQCEIQERMVHHDSNVSRLIDKLEEKGFVKRKENDANRRRVCVTITDNGMNLLSRIDPAMERQMNDSFSELTMEEASVIGRLLDRVRR